MVWPDFRAVIGQCHSTQAQLKSLIIVCMMFIVKFKVNTCTTYSFHDILKKFKMLTKQ